jgi:hypothetical protein
VIEPSTIHGSTNNKRDQNPSRTAFYESETVALVEYTDNMDYSVGSRVRVRLYNGKEVEAEITAITNQSAGRKVQIVYGNVTASINPAQITAVLPAT